MVYDCFLFNNELDILEIRLNELSSVVDKFVIVESTVKHVNVPKPLYYSENKKRFLKFKNKIIHIVVSDSPDVNLAWIINDFQFSQMARGLTKCKDTDTILLGDLDEIPKASRVKEYMDKPGKLKIFEQKLSFYYLNCVEYANPPWLGTRMITYKNFKKYDRAWVIKYSKVDVQIPDGGWHLTYIGDIKWIQEKLTGMTHQEFNNSRFNTPEKIARSISEGKDFLDAGRKFKPVSLDQLPLYVRKNKRKFGKYIIKNLGSGSFYYPLISTYLISKEKMRVVYRNIRSTARNLLDEKRQNTKNSK